MGHAVIIPMYYENKSTILLCSKLYELGADNIIVVNDSCSPNSSFFNELTSIGCHLVHLDCNRGKGACIKAGIKFAHNKLYNIDGYITCDADGQHKAEDVMRISRALELRPQNLVLGKRDFKKSKVPLNIRFGNYFSSAYFKVITGKGCRDTQTGLRGIPSSLYDIAVNTAGDRFDFEMNFLTKCADLNVPFYFVNITVDYSVPEKSNFRLVKDTYLIYRTPLKFATASVSCTAIDLVLFTVFTYLLPSSFAWNVALATLMARIISGAINFCINKKVIFSDSKRAKRQAVRFIILFFCIMCASTVFVSFLSFLPIPVTLIKAIIDLLLWTVNYNVQRRWVFK